MRKIVGRFSLRDYSFMFNSIVSMFSMIKNFWKFISDNFSAMELSEKEKVEKKQNFR